MADRITVSGIVEDTPRVVNTTASLDVATFRLRARRDRSSRVRPPSDETPGAFVVTAIGPLARAIAADTRAGDLLIVAGMLTLRAVDDDAAVVAEITAEAIGLDIRRRRSGSQAVERTDGRAVPS
jgi:single-stranded DNA-binding protein